MSQAVIVVEGGIGSGALITADFATQLGREVLAVPHRADDAGSPAPLGLLADGAGMARGVEDVFETLQLMPAKGVIPAGEASSPSTAGENVSGPDAWLVRALGREEMSAGELCGAAGMEIGEILAALGRLELDGRIGQTTAGRFFVRAGHP